MLQPVQQERSSYQTIFEKADTNKSGTLNKAEFEFCFKELGLDWNEEMAKEFDNFDNDKSGEVDYGGNI